jgi:hypothetical protein
MHVVHYNIVQRVDLIITVKCIHYYYHRYYCETMYDVLVDNDRPVQLFSTLSPFTDTMCCRASSRGNNTIVYHFDSILFVRIVQRF